MSNWTRKERASYRPINNLMLKVLYEQVGLPEDDPESRQEYLETFAKVPVVEQARLVRRVALGRRNEALNMLEEAAAAEIARMGKRYDSCALAIALHRNRDSDARKTVEDLARDVHFRQANPGYMPAQLY